MTTPRTLRHTTRDQLIRSVADDVTRLLRDLTAQQDEVHVCLTGGTVGIGVLAALDTTGIDWSRVHLWWGDERWLPRDDAERNARQATEALIDRLPTPEQQVHRFPASDSNTSLDMAVVQYARELQAHAPHSDGLPTFDLTLLGVGPDGHVASLFPGHDTLGATGTVVAERNSPKPPPERISLTLPVLNSSRRVWMAAAGGDKAPALARAIAGAPVQEIPAAGVRGRDETIIHLDAEAAAEVPQERVSDAE